MIPAIPPEVADALRGFGDVSRETEAALTRYVELLVTWTRRVNLIGRDTIPEVWTRHILDSAQLLPLIPHDRRHWLDLGSGGGLPALVCAVFIRDSHPELRLTLVESDRRKCAFLTTAVRELGLAATILPQRIEDIPPQHADLVTARALAPLDRLFCLTEPHLVPASRLILPKGARHAEEIAAARACWRFTLTAQQSITSDMSRILCCENIARV